MAPAAAALGAAFMGGTQAAVTAVVADGTAAIDAAEASTALGTAWLLYVDSCLLYFC